jgi:Resolvase, N terminal domain
MKHFCDPPRAHRNRTVIEGGANASWALSAGIDGRADRCQSGAGAARRHGWDVVDTYRDEGVSGAKGRLSRPGFDRLCKAIVRREIEMVAAWSVDRLGRSLQDLVGFLAELQASRCELYLHQQGLDTSTAAGRALFGMLSVFADFERAMIVERTKAGMARARAQGKVIGRQGSPRAWKTPYGLPWRMGWGFAGPRGCTGAGWGWCRGSSGP